MSSHGGPTESGDSQWKKGEPTNQSTYEFRDGEWAPSEHSSSLARSYPFLMVLSWVIDRKRQWSRPRIRAALTHLEAHVVKQPRPPVIMLNEMINEHLELMMATDFVRENYRMTDITTSNWAEQYGTCMLIPKYMDIKQVFRVHYEDTAEGRDALFVDMKLPWDKTLRLCSTHLESRANPSSRPAQLACAAKYMHEADASILAGNLSATEIFDQTLHIDNKLKDAYLDVGRQEGDEDGMTWGQMASKSEREQFGLSRSDKVLYCGGLYLMLFAMFGMDVEVASQITRLSLTFDGELEKGWVTDHLGVKAKFRITA